MPNTLLSGPAGSGKSQVARRMIREADQLTVLSDFQSQYVAVSGDVRDPETGLYPLRNEALLPLVEYQRRITITRANEAGFDVLVTNSVGDQARRQMLLGELGEGATEVIHDPGIDTVRGRLADAETGIVSDECEAAINRWYGEARNMKLETRSCEIRLSGNTLTGTVIELRTNRLM